MSGCGAGPRGIAFRHPRDYGRKSHKIDYGTDALAKNWKLPLIFIGLSELWRIALSG
jgi:hypothetical protein